MYAVIQSGGKQYKVQAGSAIEVEKLDVSAGQALEFTDVLMVVDGDQVQLGTPFVQGATVSAEVREHGRGRKIEVIKFRRRKHYRRRMGHRQHYTHLAITGIHPGQATGAGGGT